MAHVNWDAKPDTCPPGIYLAEIVEAEIGNSKKGDEMFTVEFKAVRTGRRICKDWIMLSGKMAFAGVKKLIALGFEPGSGAVMAHDMIGRRCYLAIGQREYKDTMQPTVDSKAQNFTFGYRHENDPPPSIPDPQAVADLGEQHWKAPPTKSEQDEIDRTPF